MPRRSGRTNRSVKRNTMRRRNTNRKVKRNTMRRINTNRKVRRNSRSNFKLMGGGLDNQGDELTIYVNMVRSQFASLFPGMSQTQLLDKIYGLIKGFDYKLSEKLGEDAVKLQKLLLYLFTARRPAGTVKVGFEPGPGPPRAFDLFGTTCEGSKTFGGFCPFYSNDDFILMAPPNQSDMMGKGWIEGTMEGFTHLMCIPINKDSGVAKTMNDLLPLTPDEISLLKSRNDFIHAGYDYISKNCGKTLDEYIKGGGDVLGLIQTRMAYLGMGHGAQFSDYVINTFKTGKAGGFAAPPWGLNPKFGMFKMKADELTHDTFVTLWQEPNGVVISGIQTPADNSQLVSHCHCVRVNRTHSQWPKIELGAGAYVDPMPYVDEARRAPVQLVTPEAAADIATSPESQRLGVGDEGVNLYGKGEGDLSPESNAYYESLMAGGGRRRSAQKR
jgi:hypothetical protein